MSEATASEDPFVALCAALDRCRPDETLLRDLVIARLLKDAKLLHEIADAEPMEYEGSIKTIRVFLSSKTWPAEDHGWVDEALGLSRHDDWYTRQDRPSSATTSDGIDRPNDRITLRVRCASALLGDSARYAPFSNADEEPGADTCVGLVDASCRLGGPGVLDSSILGAVADRRPEATRVSAEAFCRRFLRERTPARSRP